MRPHIVYVPALICICLVKSGLSNNNCGELDKNLLPTKDGPVEKVGSTPWFVAIYKSDPDYRFICGGTLLSPKVVISAAHCFSDPMNGNLFDTKDYFVAAGKIYSKYDDERDRKTAEKRKVTKIFTTPEYKGLILNYAHDIALVLLDKPIESNSVIRSVCIDQDRKGLITEKSATVAGFGIKGFGNNDNLKTLQVDLVDRDTCFKLEPPDFISFITADKLCVAYNKAPGGLCQGDGGSGVITSGDNGRYFIRGIVSNGPLKEYTCDITKPTTYTQISKHLDFINDILKTYD